MTDNTLFNQSSSQLNFLLLAQRNMILIFAFSLTFLAFSTNLRKRFLIMFIMSCLLIYSLAIGIVSIINYNKYDNKTRSDLGPLTSDNEAEIEMMNDWYRWTYFTYVLLGLNGVIILFYFLYEIGFYDPVKKKKTYKSSRLTVSEPSLQDK